MQADDVQVAAARVWARSEGRQMARRIDDRSRFPRAMNARLDELLELDERILVAIPGTLGSGLAATDRHVFLWKRGAMQAYRLADLDAAEFSTGLLEWVMLRGPGLDPSRPSLGNVGHHPNAIQTQRLSEAAKAELQRLVAGHGDRGAQPQGSPCEATLQEEELLCTACWSRVSAPPDSPGFVCSACGNTFRWGRCSHCRSVDQLPQAVQATHRWRCAFCGLENRERRAPAPTPVTTAERAAELRRREMLGGAEVRFLGAFTIFGSTGFSVPASAVCSLECREAVLRIRVEIGAADVLDLPYDEIVTLETEGGRYTTGSSFFGGGFGALGALEGAGMALLLTKLSQRTTTNTVMRIATTSGEIWLHHGQWTPQEVRIVLASLWARYAGSDKRTKETGAGVPDSAVDVLTKLADLHRSGALTDEEFAAKKAELLARM